MKNLKKIREEKKITQLELAKMLSVSQSTIAMWETGEAMPRSDKLPELAKILGCSIDELYKEV